MFLRADAIVSSAYDAFSSSNEKAASVMPTSYEQLNHVMTTSPSQNSIKKLAKHLAREIGTSPRSVDWIRGNGLCVDNIVPRPSKLPHAGQGAIAQRFVPKGDVVMPAPLLHILDRELLRLTGDNSKETYQLLLNYCFGHTRSSLLLCPITNAMLINHCSTRKRECGKDGPNAEYQWASGWDSGKTERWLDMSFEELAQKTWRGLSMDIVATRDIEEGEEVFIDYGREWEEAWEKHVANWKPPVDSTFQSYVSPTELNEKEGPFEMLVSGDLREKVDHPNLFTGCIFWETNFDEESRWSITDLNWEQLDNITLLERFASNDGAEYFGDYEDQHDGSYWPCSVIRSEDDDGSTYTVRILGPTRGHSHKPTWYKNRLPRFITKYPRESIRYFNGPYKSDQHVPGAFRHHIEIRNDIFPEQWKDLL